MAITVLNNTQYLKTILLCIIIFFRKATPSPPVVNIRWHRIPSSLKCHDACVIAACWSCGPWTCDCRPRVSVRSDRETRGRVPLHILLQKSLGERVEPREGSRGRLPLLVHLWLDAPSVITGRMLKLVSLDVRCLHWVQCFGSEQRLSNVSNKTCFFYICTDNTDIQHCIFLKLFIFIMPCVQDI